MYVYSGECRLCDCGIDTKETDSFENELKTGDIVIIWHEDDGMIDMSPDHLTVIVCSQYQSYSDGTIKLLKYSDFWCMGIKNIGLSRDNNWKIRKVKNYKDAIDGEHWQEFKFRYSRK